MRRLNRKSCKRWAGNCRAVAGLFFLALGFCGGTWAGSYTVDPVKVVLSMDKRAAALRVNNTHTSTVTVQVDTLQWSGVQAKSHMDLPRSKDLLAMPPIFTLQPGQQQIVRVGLRKPNQAEQEMAYRLMFKEVPPPPKPGAPMLQMALQMSIPVFVMPVAPVKAQPRWQAELQDDGRLSLMVNNDGSAHLKFTGWQLKRSDGSQVAATEGLVYVLPGGRKHFDVELAAPLQRGEELTLNIESGQRGERVSVTLR